MLCIAYNTHAVICYEQVVIKVVICSNDMEVVSINYGWSAQISSSERGVFFILILREKCSAVCGLTVRK